MKYNRHSLIILKKSTRPLISKGEKDDAFFYNWIAKQYPLIYTRQSNLKNSETFQVGLPYYNSESGRKYHYSYLVRKSDELEVEKLPLISEVFSDYALKFSHNIKVYGSYCWQYLTKLSYVHSDSDLDILIEYSSQSIKEFTVLLKKIREILSISKIDGEIRFKGLGDCSISELLDTQSLSILFKNSCNVFLVNRIHLYEKYPSLFLQ